MADDLVIVEVYHPPKDGLPYLAVAIMPDGKVHGVTADTAASAQRMGDDILAVMAPAEALLAISEALTTAKYRCQQEF